MLETIKHLIEERLPELDADITDYVLGILEDGLPEDVESFLSPLCGDDDETKEILLQEIHQLSQPESDSATLEISNRRPVKLKDCFQDEEAALAQSFEKASVTDKEINATTTPERHNRKSKANKQTHHSENQESTSSFVEDNASAWEQTVQEEGTWGGRGKGGRGEYAGAVNSVKSNIHLSDVSISLDNGMDLLRNSTMDIMRGHRYGLLGRNGVGKSTLLRRLVQKSIPGMPHDMRIILVQQQIEGSELSALQTLVDADIDRLQLLEEQEEMETKLESEECTSDELAHVAERLGEIADELDAIRADQAEERAEQILKGLQFTDDMIHGKTSQLSGGWRMRLALARSLFVPCHLLLLDECTNHLDLHGMSWLIEYLQKKSDRTLIVVSHDSSFLDAVCTDIVVLQHQRLTYHVGNYSEYIRQQSERATRESQILDAAARQRAKAEAFVQKQQANRKSTDPNKQRQAKMIKEKKMDRIGNYREDGKRYKLRSLKTLDESSVRLAQKVTVEVDDPLIEIKFPNPVWPPGVAPGDDIVRIEDLSFGFTDEKLLLDSVTLSLTRGSKVALVGNNGSGKSSLVKLITGDIDSASAKGTLWKYPTLTMGHVCQYSVEELERYASMTVVEYAEEILSKSKAAIKVMKKGSGNIRQYLGAFGLGGSHALQAIGKLSGGERMRLCFATVLADEPQLLLLDESTNHVDIETLESLSHALNTFEGSVLMVSHNQAFLSGFCKELWVLADGKIDVMHSDTSSFDEIFSEYRHRISSSANGTSSGRRKEKAKMAKQAKQQQMGTKQNTALL
ncbi:hypothetical protein FisN_2Lh414 [Fistulifera solaris]|uniref:ABC transporter domain-containing protein n=1 Tax=Fistulifera solaris TaxID=1519565 RepID=A0A1Z5JQ15_FISSO|nr:hypothetical protein FisN_2Lh414 [Fistulifera solaris]|eukprot:GAX15858.1 hypothetical protein FisN_2Lh414 [Fistulifera solaris]